MSSTYFQMPLGFPDDNLSIPAEHPLQGTSNSPPSSVSAHPSPVGFHAKAQPARAPSGGSGGGNRKGTSAERRATHNAIERARRESLNGRFLQLAASLPAISDVRRPSKSLIVNKSLDFVYESLSRETMYRSKLSNLRSENDQLRNQLNEFRRRAGLDNLPSPAVDELPRPLAEMGTKKRNGSLAGTVTSGGELGELGDLDEEDGFNGASSEGETTRASPVAAPALSAAPGLGTISGMPSYNGVQAAQLAAQPSSKLLGSDVAQQQARSSSTPSARSESLNTNVQGSWNYAPASAAPAFHGADFAFAAGPTLLGNNLVGNQGPAVGFPHYVSQNLPDTLPDATSLGAIPQTQNVQIDPFASMRNQQQQTYTQYMSSFDLGHQPRPHPHHNNHHHHQQQQHFFDQAPLQSATFMTAV